MITKKLFSVHSPVWQMLFATTGILMVTTLYALFILGDPNHAIMTLEQTSTGQGASVEFNLWLLTALVVGISSVVAYSVICHRYNKKSSSKLRLFSLKPNEIISDDERLLQASATASLKIYSQNHILFPVLALALIFTVGSGSIAILAAVLITSVAIYYLTYLKAMWPYLGNK